MKSLTQHHHQQQQNNLSMGGGGELAHHQQTRQIAWHCRQLAMSTAAQLAHLIKRSAMGGGDESVAEACESYVITFQRAFLSHFPQISHQGVATGGSGASGALRKNQSDSNFATTLAHFKLDEAWTKGSNSSINAADNNNRNNNKKKGWCSRLSYFATTASGKNPHHNHHADNDVSPDDVACEVDDDAFADSSLSTESINSLGGASTKTTTTTISSNSKLLHQHQHNSNKNLWNRIRRASKSSKISEEEENAVKATAICELRINSNNTQHQQQQQNTFTPFLKSRIVLRSQESGGYQFVIFTPAKSSKSKYVINGADVTEVRPTEASTNYHSRHCFVLKSHDYEVVVKLECWEDVLVWLNEIEDAHMKIDSPNSNIYVCHKTHYTPRFLRNQQHQPTTTDPSDTGSFSTSKKSKKSSLARLRSGGSSSCAAKLLCDGIEDLDETLTTTETGERSKKEEKRSADDYYTRVGVWKATRAGFEPATASLTTIGSSEDVVTGATLATMSRCSSSSSGGDVTTLTTSSTDDGDDKSSLPGGEEASASVVGDGGVDSLLLRGGADVTRHPWFHGRMSRGEASDLLKSLCCLVKTDEEGEEEGGVEGAAMPREGTFLLRYSSNQRCHVITIVCRKQHYQHLRMAVDREGRCRINNRCFSSVVDMLAYFHRHPISMDTANRVILTDFVINRSRFTGNGGTEGRLEPVNNGGGSLGGGGRQASSSSGLDHDKMMR